MARKRDGEVCRDWCDKGCSTVETCFEQENGDFYCHTFCHGYLYADGTGCESGCTGCHNWQTAPCYRGAAT